MCRYCTTTYTYTIPCISVSVYRTMHPCIHASMHRGGVLVYCVISCGVLYHYVCRYIPYYQDRTCIRTCPRRAPYIRVVVVHVYRMQVMHHTYTYTIPCISVSVYRSMHPCIHASIVCGGVLVYCIVWCVWCVIPLRVHVYPLLPG